MKPWKAILGVVAVFLLGMGAGALLMHRVDQNRFKMFMRGGPVVNEMIVRRFSAELQLTEPQRGQLLEIIRTTQRELREARQKPDPQFRLVLQNMEQRIRDILTPEQQVTFDKLMGERKARLQMLLMPPPPNPDAQRFRGPGGPGPGGGPRRPPEPQP